MSTIKGEIKIPRGIESAHLGAVGRIGCMVDIGGVSAELLQHFPRLQAVHACQAVIGCAENMRAVPREGHGGNAL